MNSPQKKQSNHEAMRERQAITDHIHLLYVPTLHCNLGCRYCYLGGQTDAASLRRDAESAVPTLERALRSFIDEGILPFNVSLHGGEVTTLPEPVLEELFAVIRRHYVKHYDELTALGFRKSDPHVKTNLYNFNQRYELFERNRVSVSASIDLPLALHGEYRRDRRGGSWLDAALENLRLLGRYPHAKKISSTLYREHLDDIPAIINDIWRIHRELGFNMTNFNVMFGFESSMNREKFGDGSPGGIHQADEEQQLRLYEAMKNAFVGTELEYGLRRHWFDEFKPEYCTNAFNCGERFFLLQGDGSVHSCVRGQGLPQFHYGSMFEHGARDIMAAARSAVSRAHQEQGLDGECRRCEHLYRCHTGCPVVKTYNRRGRSYTCALQKAIYRDNPHSYPPMSDPGERTYALREYIAGVHPGLVFDEEAVGGAPGGAGVLLPGEIGDDRNALAALIARDPVLGALYDDRAFVISVNETIVPLRSQILARERFFYVLGGGDRIAVHVLRSLLTVNCDEPVRNTLYVQMLRDTPIVYGDEKRTKQEHLFTHQVYSNMLAPSDALGPDYVMADITELVAMYRGHYRAKVLNNLLVTTLYLRDYHYQKQKANAFYHIQAVNLPFQNIEFYWKERT